MREKESQAGGCLFKQIQGYIKTAVQVWPFGGGLELAAQQKKWKNNTDFKGMNDFFFFIYVADEPHIN